MDPPSSDGTSDRTQPLPYGGEALLMRSLPKKAPFREEAIFFGLRKLQERSFSRPDPPSQELLGLMLFSFSFIPPASSPLFFPPVSTPPPPGKESCAPFDQAFISRAPLFREGW